MRPAANTTTQARAPPRPVFTLEPVARSGAGRVLAWTRHDTTVHTPLLLVRPGADDARPGAGLLLGPSDTPPETTATPVVRVLGGFQAQEPLPAADAVWSDILVPRARRMAGQLALRRRPVRDEDDEGPSEEGPRFTAPPGALPVGPVPDAHGNVALFAEAASAYPDAGRLIPLLIDARERAGPARILYAPGIGLPHELALFVYAGLDAFDTLAAERATLLGRYLTPEGAHDAARLAAPLCACATCHNTAPRDLDPAALGRHNLTVLHDEMQRVRGHLHADTLRELVEQRVRAHPVTTAMLRHLDRHGAGHFRTIPLARTAAVSVTTMEALHRPDVVRYRQRVAQDYRPPASADVLLLLPCSASKPYHRSKSHAVFQRVLGDLHAASLVHEVMITSPLGIVPRELEHTWPAAHYDVAVTGHWDREETHMIRAQLAGLLTRHPYRRVVSHVGPATHALIADLLPPDAVFTGTPHPTAYPARDALRGALMDATRGTTAPNWPRRRLDEFHAIATWQFGPEAAAALVGDAGDVSGRPPATRIYAERPKRTPLAAFVPDRGLISLTLDGARRLLDAGCAKIVEIEDFTPRGTLFAVGVRDADPSIVPGDEVVLTHQGAMKGVARALLGGPEMVAFRRGPAAEVRHHA